MTMIMTRFYNYVKNIFKYSNNSTYSNLNTNYEDLVSQIKDEEIRELFIEFTKDENEEWDDITYEIFEKIIKTSFKDLNNILYNNYYKIMILSLPQTWCLYVKDEDFLKYIEISWNAYKKIYKEYVNSLKNGVDNETASRSEMKKYVKIVQILQNIHGERFSAE